MTQPQKLAGIPSTYSGWQVQFNTKPLTLDEVIAEHGDRIVRVHYSIDSDSEFAELEIKACYDFLTTLRYIGDGRIWQLQAYTVDSTEHESRNDAAVRRVIGALRKMGQ